MRNAGDRFRAFLERALASVRARVVTVAGRAPLVAVLSVFLGGLVFWGAFNTAMEATNTLPFCISCHEMRSTVYEEFRHTVHFTNPSGVQAVCSDCHVPKDWTAKLVRKIKASKELLYWALGTIDTPEKFEARRLVLATRVWEAMKSSDSQECRNCHNFPAMDTGGQGRFAGRLHQEAVEGSKTCIDCHKGISHRLPATPKPAKEAPAGFDEELAEEINMTCAPCHGRQGQGTADGVYPRLAGLDPAYLTRQIEHFKSKQRLNIPMLPYATERELPPEDVRTIVAYLSSIELARKIGAVEERGFDALARLRESKAVLNVPLHTGDAQKGRRSFDKECASCHGRDGYGDRTRAIPQLAGQHTLYLKRQIDDFRSGARLHDAPADAAIFAQFTDGEVADILTYVSTLDDH
jgi:cytochrome c-type protein NapC